MRPLFVYIDMERNDKISDDSAGLEPPQRLRHSIFTRIRQEEYHRAKVHFLASFAVLPFSIFGVVFALQYMVQEFYRSGFYNYFSLIASDTDAVLVYWREFALSLVETLPLFGITVSLAAIVLLLVMIRTSAVNFRNRRTFSFSN